MRIRSLLINSLFLDRPFPDKQFPSVSAVERVQSIEGEARISRYSGFEGMRTIAKNFFFSSHS